MANRILTKDLAPPFHFDRMAMILNGEPIDTTVGHTFPPTCPLKGSRALMAIPVNSK